MTYVPEVGAAGDRTVTLIPGDGIGPEVAGAVEEVVAALGAPILWDRFPGVSGTCPDGSPALEIDPAVLASIRRNGACFKGTLFTPLTASNTSTQSLNVALRKALDLHVNLVHGFNTPGVPSRWSGLDIVVIRENTEGEYSGLGETKKGGCGERGGESWREREREWGWWVGPPSLSVHVFTIPFLLAAAARLSSLVSLHTQSTRSPPPTSSSPSRSSPPKSPAGRASSRLGTPS